MSNSRCLYTDSYYHVYNRGYNKQQLFFNHRDYERFCQKLDQYLIEYPNIQIKNYCILPNHFHFLLLETGLDQEPNQISVNISNFMRKLQVSYSMYFNARYGETVKLGLKYPVFEGRFKAKLIEDEYYLHQVTTYVESNAVKHELVTKAEDWPYSSFSIETGL